VDKIAASESLVSICISTHGTGIERLTTWIFDTRVIYLIFWQTDEQAELDFTFPCNVRVYRLASRGVTVSRNLAIQKCCTKWLWFMDDDVFIPNTSIDNLLLLLPKYDPRDILIASVDFGVQKLNKVFIKETISIFSIFGIGTIQIICCPEIARSSMSSFPVNMGAGSPYPVCDEPVFIFRLLKKARVKLCGVPGVVVKHPPLSSGANFRGHAHLSSRAMLFREIFGFPLCILFSILFFLKHSRKIGFDFRYLFNFRKPL